MKRLLLTAPLALFCCLGLGAQSNPTELRIHPVDESGNPIQVSRAEIYLDLWGGGEKISVPFDESDGFQAAVDPEFPQDIFRVVPNGFGTDA